MDSLFRSLYIHRELHAILFEPVCRKYGLTLTEIQVLLFLYEHEQNNTAKDIVGSLKIAKSYVSSAVHILEEGGYVEGSHEGNDRRSVHLRLCEKSNEIVKESLEIQTQFTEALKQGFSENELEILRKNMTRLLENAEGFLREYTDRKTK